MLIFLASVNRQTETFYQEILFEIFERIIFLRVISFYFVLLRV